MSFNVVEGKLREIYKNSDKDKFSALAFTLYYFTDKLYTRLIELGFEDVFFLSREGEFLKKIFDKYQENLPQSAKKVNSHYLIVSRRSTTLPSLRTLREEDFDIIFRQYYDISIYDFLSSIGFEESEIRAIGKELDFDVYERQKDFRHTYIYRRLRKNELFQKLYEGKRFEQKENFTKYLESFGVDYSERICIVDVGWKGTIQDNIFEFFEEKIDVIGLYLGIHGHGILDPMNTKEGLLFYSDWDRYTPYFFVFADSTAIYEVLLGASHGSAYNYKDENGVIVPVTKEEDKELELFRNVITPIQDVMFDVFSQIDEVCKNSKEEIPESFWADIHADLIFNPNKNQIKAFDNMYHFENFGVFEYTVFDNKKATFGKTISAFFSLLKRPGVFLKSEFWSPVTLYKNGLGFLCGLYGTVAYNKFYKRKPGQLEKINGSLDK